MFVVDVIGDHIVLVLLRLWMIRAMSPCVLPHLVKKGALSIVIVLDVLAAVFVVSEFRICDHQCMITGRLSVLLHHLWVRNLVCWWCVVCSLLCLCLMLCSEVMLHLGMVCIDWILWCVCSSCKYRIVWDEATMLG